MLQECQQKNDSFENGSHAKDPDEKGERHGEKGFLKSITHFHLSVKKNSTQKIAVKTN